MGLARKFMGQYGRPPLATAGLLVIVRHMQKFRAKGKKLYFGFVDLEKVFDRVPREVIKWAMHKLGVEEWLVLAVISMYTGAKTSIILYLLPPSIAIHAIHPVNVCA